MAIPAPTAPRSRAQQLNDLARSAATYFGVSAKQRNFILVRAGKGSVRTAEDMRVSLDIRRDAWEDFVKTYRAVGEIRSFSGTAYHHVQGAKEERGGGNPTTDPFSTDPAPFNPLPLPADFNDERTEEEKADAEASELETAKALNAMLDAEVKTLRAEVEALRNPNRGPLSIVVSNGLMETGRVDRGHFMLPALLKRVAARVNVCLVGPAGSGKTSAAEQVADLCGLSFGAISVGMQTTKSDLFGFISAAGAYVTTEFRKRYELGGVFLIDEIDAGNAGVLTSLNAALAGSICAFPDGMVKRHPDFICIAAGNTFGTGPDRVYVGRQELDGASLDRFDFLEWPYDEGLEEAIARALWPEFPDKAATWATLVQSIRKAVQELGIRLVVSPRATQHGIKLMRQGVSAQDVLVSSVWKSLKPADRERVVASVEETAQLAEYLERLQ